MPWQPVKKVSQFLLSPSKEADASGCSSVIKDVQKFQLIMSLSRTNKFAFKSHSEAAPVRQKVAQSCGTGMKTPLQLLMSMLGFTFQKPVRLKSKIHRFVNFHPSQSAGRGPGYQQVHIVSISVTFFCCCEKTPRPRQLVEERVYWGLHSIGHHAGSMTAGR